MPDQIIINIELIYGVCIFIAALAVAIVYIKKGIGPLTKPYKELRLKTVHYDKCLDSDNIRIKKLEEMAEENKKDTKIIMRSLMVLLEHAETGNATGKCGTQKEALQNYITDK